MDNIRAYEMRNGGVALYGDFDLLEKLIDFANETHASDPKACPAIECLKADPKRADRKQQFSSRFKAPESDDADEDDDFDSED